MTSFGNTRRIAATVVRERLVADQARAGPLLELAKLEGRLEPARRYMAVLPESRGNTSFLLSHRSVPDARLGSSASSSSASPLKGFFEFWQESLVGSVVNLSLFDLRNRFYRNVIHLDVEQLRRGGHARADGPLHQRHGDCSAPGMKTLFGKVVAEPLQASGCVVVACWISWQLTLMFLILVPVALFILTKVGRIMKRATRRLLERMSSIYKILQETFQGIRVVKAFTMEPYERRRFRTADQATTTTRRCWW